MREAVWAIYFHKLSSDVEPLHNFCSVEWRQYKQAERDGTLSQYKHKGNLPQVVMEAIKPIFRDLGKTELLNKCLDGYTQNANESFNSIIWKLCPKSKNHGLKTVQTAVAIAACVFNDGGSSLLSILKEMNIQPGIFMKAYCEQTDIVRIQNAQRQAVSATKEARKAKRQKRLAQNEADVHREGYPYLAGAH